MKMFGNDYVKQHDTRDCAAACMASVCNLYGLHISLLHMRELLKIDKNGTSMYALMEVANKVGFSCEVLQGNWQEFSGEILERKICLPAICHMHIDGLEHFVIVKKVTNKGIWIFDPAKGHIKYSLELFESQWTGYVLNLYSVNIEKEIRKKKKKSFQYMDILISLRWKFVFILLISFLIAGISIIYSYFYQKIIDQFILFASISAIFVWNDDLYDTLSVCFSYDQRKNISDSRKKGRYISVPKICFKIATFTIFIFSAMGNWRYNGTISGYGFCTECNIRQCAYNYF